MKKEIKMKINIKAKHLYCPICKTVMCRSEGNVENWVCTDCNITLFMRIVGNNARKNR